MENTCNFSECKMAKKMGFETASDCFNFIESWWTSLDGQPKLIQDCAPRRTILMIQEHYNRLIGLQQAQEQQRNVNTQVLQKFSGLVEAVNFALSHKNQKSKHAIIAGKNE